MKNSKLLKIGGFIIGGIVIVGGIILAICLDGDVDLPDIDILDLFGGADVADVADVAVDSLIISSALDNDIDLDIDVDPKLSSKCWCSVVDFFADIADFFVDIWPFSDKKEAKKEDSVNLKKEDPLSLKKENNTYKKVKYATIPRE